MNGRRGALAGTGSENDCRSSRYGVAAGEDMPKRGLCAFVLHDQAPPFVGVETLGRLQQ